mmetsp:Transcript_807/g.1312  ORF Transcript_807/g.1312 Transcript_807/m.1312 type:complete len:240 (-) Transcript_807:798-1517(-)
MQRLLECVVLGGVKIKIESFQLMAQGLESRVLIRQLHVFEVNKVLETWTLECVVIAFSRESGEVLLQCSNLLHCSNLFLLQCSNLFLRCYKLVLKRFQLVVFQKASARSMCPHLCHLRFEDFLFLYHLGLSSNGRLGKGGHFLSLKLPALCKFGKRAVMGVMGCLHVAIPCLPRVLTLRPSSLLLHFPATRSKLVLLSYFGLALMQWILLLRERLAPLSLARELTNGHATLSWLGGWCA